MLLDNQRRNRPLPFLSSNLICRASCFPNKHLRHIFFTHRARERGREKPCRERLASRFCFLFLACLCFGGVAFAMDVACCYSTGVLPFSTNANPLHPPHASFVSFFPSSLTARLSGNLHHLFAYRLQKDVSGDSRTVRVRSCKAQQSRKRPQYVPNKIDDPSYVRIFDTTLRDGEQSPGATLTSKEKLDIARQLAKLGVDIIEAGFPIASPDDLEAVRMISLEVGNNVNSEGYVPVICGLARCSKPDIDAAWEAVRHALRPRIHVFIATSEIHMKHKLRKTPEEVVETARRMVRYARSLGCQDVEFSPEDAGRSDPSFLYQILGEVIKAGATTLNIPDTVGYTLPSEFGDLIAKIKENTPGANDIIISTHCQNDLGLATANTLAGACAGARQVEVTINGIGERAGNASLEEVVMAIRCRGQEIMNGLFTGINTKQIAMASKMVTDYTGMMVQPHKAIVGANAFAHESGIHQDGMLKFKGTYEIMAPDDIGISRADESGIVLGKLSGRHALKTRLLQLGYELESKELDDVFKRFKAVAEKKKALSDEDLEALVSDEVFQPQVVWALSDLQVVCGTMGFSTATVRLLGPDGLQQFGTSVGTGPVDAAYKAIDLIVKIPVTLLEYSLIAVTEGIDALANTRVVIRADNSPSVTHAQSGKLVQRSFSGTGAGEDVVVSSARAYVSALNKLIGSVSPAVTRQIQHIQEPTVAV